MAWIERVAQRGQKHTVYEDSEQPGRFQLVASVHDQHYRDGTGEWQPVVEEAQTDSSVPGYTRRADRMAHKTLIGNGAERRWYPRRNVPSEYVDWAAPEYWQTAGGGSWQTLPLGTVNHLLSGSVWENASIRAEISLNWRGVRKLITLKSAPPATRLRWAYMLVGLHWDGWKLVSDAEGTAAGCVEPISAHDSDGSDPMTGGKPVPTTTTNTAPTGTSGAVEWTIDLANAVYPVVVDPTTLTFQPTAATAKETRIENKNPTFNYGAADEINFGWYDETQQYRLLIAFDISSIPTTATVTAATLTLTKSGNFGTYQYTCSAYKLLRDWAEGTGTGSATGDGATWNTYDGSNNWGTAGCDNTTSDREASGEDAHAVDPTAATQVFSVPNMAQDWVTTPASNYGLIVLTTATYSAQGVPRLESSDGWGSDPGIPKLEVTYTTLPVGTTCWGHTTGVTETNTRTFATNWTGTGTLAGAGDAETVTLSSGEYVEGEVVNTGARIVALLLNQYTTGAAVTIKYRTGASTGACEAATWTTYSTAFISDGYAQVRLESTL